jgi:homoserine dehydrogenase
VANHIQAAYGILNGTCNYILTRMEQEGLPFDEVLKAAQSAGLCGGGAQPGHRRARHRAQGGPAGLAGLWFPGAHEEPARGGHPRAGPGGNPLCRRAGLSHQAAGHHQAGPRAVSVRVHPTLVPHSHMLASVGGVFNAVLVRGDIVGDTCTTGAGRGVCPRPARCWPMWPMWRAVWPRGARRSAGVPGGRQTAAAVAASGNGGGALLPAAVAAGQAGRAGPRGPGAGAAQISIASMIQKEQSRGDYVPVIILTHTAVEKNFQAALARLTAWMW